MKKKENKAMKKNKAIAVVIVTALFLGLLTFTAAIGFGPTGTGSAKEHQYRTGSGWRCKYHLSGSRR